MFYNFSSSWYYTWHLVALLPLIFIADIFIILSLDLLEASIEGVEQGRQVALRQALLLDFFREVFTTRRVFATCFHFLFPLFTSSFIYGFSIFLDIIYLLNCVYFTCFSMFNNRYVAWSSIVWVVGFINIQHGGCQWNWLDNKKSSPHTSGVGVILVVTSGVS